MSVLIGIDVGGSTTKIVGIKEDKIISPMCITAADPVTSLFGAFGRYIYEQGLQLSDVEHVMLTGVGSAYVNTPLYGLPTTKAAEFQPNGLGARHATDLDRLIVVSLGTGTSFVQIEGEHIFQIGSLAIGGGTLMGLSRMLLRTSNVNELSELAETGDVTRINLQIGDICNTTLSNNLPVHATASLLGKATTNTLPEDIACGLIFTVMQTMGSAAVLAARNTGIKDFFLIGNLTSLPQCHEDFKMVEDIYGVRFHIPPYSEYRTAIGAALSYYESKK